MLSGVAITISGCGGDTGNPMTPTSVGGGASGVVGANHGHSASVTSAQLMSAGEVSLDITGTADHPHTVVLTPAELQQISDGARVSKTSTINAGHAHTVTFN